MACARSLALSCSRSLEYLRPHNRPSTSCGATRRQVSAGAAQRTLFRGAFELGPCCIPVDTPVVVSAVLAGADAPAFAARKGAPAACAACSSCQYTCVWQCRGTGTASAVSRHPVTRPGTFWRPKTDLELVTLAPDPFVPSLEVFAHLSHSAAGTLLIIVNRSDSVYA